MKILHVETGRHLYGGALQVYYLLRGLHQRGVENLLACPVDSAIAKAAEPFAQIHQLPMRGDLDVLFGYRLWRLLRKTNPDILHIHSRRGADLWGSLVTRMTGQAAVLTRRVDNPEPAWLAGWKYQPFRRVVTISEGIREVLLAEGLSAAKVECIHSAVDIEAWQKNADQKWFRREFSLLEGVKTVAVIAQLIERKGHRYLIDAMPNILQSVPDARFLFLGQGPLEAELRQLCRSKGIEHAVEFCGFRDDLARILPNLDLVVHPALMEGLGVSLLQAAAAGVPIVAFRAGGVPEIVHHEKNGVLIDSPDSVMLSREVIALLSGQKGFGFGAWGQKFVEKNFSVDRMVEQNMTLYVELIGQ